MTTIVWGIIANHSRRSPAWLPPPPKPPTYPRLSLPPSLLTAESPERALGSPRSIACQLPPSVPRFVHLDMNFLHLVVRQHVATGRANRQSRTVVSLVDCKGS